MRAFRLFTTGSNKKLAQDVGRLLKCELGKIEIATFADSEKRVRIEENVTDATVVVIASLSNPVDSSLVELCLLGDALKSNDCGKMIAVIAYYGYGRQDKAHREGEGVSARVMAKLIEAVDFDKIVAIDLHSDLVSGYFRKPITHLFGAEIFVEPLKALTDDLVIVAPDAGAAKRAQFFAEKLHAPLALIEKKRDLDKLHELKSVRFIGETKNKIAVLVDDVITSGSTLVKAAYALKEQGATKVFACVTHADFVDGTPSVLQNSPLDGVYVSDSIHLPQELRFPKLHIVALSHMLAQHVKKILA